MKSLKSAIPGLDKNEGLSGDDEAVTPSSAVLLSVPAVRPNAKTEISVAAPRTMVNIRRDLVMSFPPLENGRANW